MGKRTPSPATVISIIALVLSVGGAAVASVATVSVLSKKEKKQTRNIAKDEINKAAPGLSVGSATTAANALALGGVGSAGFVQTDCSGYGAVKGFAHVLASGSFSSTFTSVFGQSCSGGAVEARRLNVGDYEVRFTGNPATLALGMSLTPSGGGISNSFVTMRQIAAGRFEVVNYNQGGGGGDVPFVVILI